MSGDKKGEYRGGGRDQKGTPSTMDLGCAPSSALKGSCPIPRHTPKSQACSGSPWAAQRDSSRAGLFADPRKGC